MLERCRTGRFAIVCYAAASSHHPRSRRVPVCRLLGLEPPLLSSPLFLLNAESDLNAESLFVILSPENNRSERCSTRSNCLSSWIRVYEYLKFNLIRSSDSSHLAHVREFYNKNYALWFERKLIINNIRLKSFNFNTRLVLIKILIIMV